MNLIDLHSSLSANLHLIVFSDISGILLSQMIPVEFCGVSGEEITKVVDLSGFNLLHLDSQVFLSVELVDLHVDVDVDIELNLGGMQVFSLLEGVLTQLFDPVLGSGGAESERAVLTIVGAHIQDGKLLINVILDADVSGGAEVDVQVNLLAIAGVSVCHRMVHVTSNGFAGEVQTVVIANVPLIGSLTMEASLLNLKVEGNVIVDISSVLVQHVFGLL